MHIACVSSCLFGLNPKIQWLSCTQGQTKLTYWTSFNVEFIRIMFTCQNIGAISLTPYFRQNNFSAGVSSFRIGQIYIMFRMCKFLSAIGLEDKFQSHLPLKIKIEENRKLRQRKCSRSCFCTLTKTTNSLLTPFYLQSHGHSSYRNFFW